MIKKNRCSKENNQKNFKKKRNHDGLLKKKYLRILLKHYYNFIRKKYKLKGI